MNPRFLDELTARMMAENERPETRPQSSTVQDEIAKMRAKNAAALRELGIKS